MTISEMAPQMVSLLTGVLAGFQTHQFLLIVVAAFIGAVSIGLMQPRFQKAVFSFIPEDEMGTVQSGIGLVDMFVPSLLTMVFVALATGLGMVWMTVSLAVCLAASLCMVRGMTDLPV